MKTLNISNDSFIKSLENPFAKILLTVAYCRLFLLNFIFKKDIFEYIP